MYQCSYELPLLAHRIDHTPVTFYTSRIFICDYLVGGRDLSRPYTNAVCLTNMNVCRDAIYRVRFAASAHSIS